MFSSSSTLTVQNVGGLSIQCLEMQSRQKNKNKNKTHSLLRWRLKGRQAVSDVR